MYCTIRTGTASTADLTPDAAEAHQRLSRQAAALAGLSASFAGEALAVADAYAGALADGSRDAWAFFVAAAAAVAGHSARVAPILTLSDRERTAADFFAQIAHENHDLLVGEADAAA